MRILISENLIKTILDEVEKYQVQGKNTFKELIDHDKLNYSDIEYIKMKKLFSAPKTPQKLITAPLEVELNDNYNNNKTLSAKKEEPKEKTELKEVKVSFEDKKEEINNNKDNNNNEINNKEEKDKDLKEKEDKEKKEIKDPLLEDDLDDKENIENKRSFNFIKA